MHIEKSKSLARPGAGAVGYIMRYFSTNRIRLPGVFRLHTSCASGAKVYVTI